MSELRNSTCNAWEAREGRTDSREPKSSLGGGHKRGAVGVSAGEGYKAEASKQSTEEKERMVLSRSLNMGF